MLLGLTNRVFQHSMDHGNKISSVPYIKSECRPCHNRLGRVRNRLKKTHALFLLQALPVPAAEPCGGSTWTIAIVLTASGATYVPIVTQ